MAADLIYENSDDLDPALRRSTELLVSELDRFETLLNDLLEISRHDAGVAELSVEAVDLRTTVNRALGNVGHLAADSGIEMLVDMPDEAIIAEVDAGSEADAARASLLEWSQHPAVVVAVLPVAHAADVGGI
jgi:two-component system sensor histidine kinase MtrB